MAADRLENDFRPISATAVLLISHAPEMLKCLHRQYHSKNVRTPEQEEESSTEGDCARVQPAHHTDAEPDNRGVHNPRGNEDVDHQAHQRGPPHECMPCVARYRHQL